MKNQIFNRIKTKLKDTLRLHNVVDNRINQIIKETDSCTTIYEVCDVLRTNKICETQILLILSDTIQSLDWEIKQTHDN